VKEAVVVTLAWCVTANHQLIIALTQFGREFEF